MGSPMVSLVWECDVIMSIVGYQYGEPYGQQECDVIMSIVGYQYGEPYGQSSVGMGCHHVDCRVPLWEALWSV